MSCQKMIVMMLTAFPASAFACLQIPSWKRQRFDMAVHEDGALVSRGLPTLAKRLTHDADITFTLHAAGKDGMLEKALGSLVYNGDQYSPRH